MDIQALKQLTPKKVVLFIALLLLTFIVGVVVWGVIGYTQQSLGISGSVMLAPSAPSMNVAFDSVGYAEESYAGGRAMKTSEMMMPPDSIMPVPSPGAPSTQSMIIQNADLTLLVDDVDESVKQIATIREGLHGQVGSVSVSDYYTSRQGDVTIWVPSEDFDTALTQIKAIALRVTNERVNATDVSAQFVDLEARLKNARVTEAQYLEMMKRTGTIPDVLAVTRELSQTRQVIEQLQGQMNHLSRQVALSSIHITLTQEVATVVAKNEWRPLAVLKNASRATLRDLTGFIDSVIVLLVNLPVFLLKVAFWGGLLYGVWWLGRAFYRHLRGLSLPTGGGAV